MLMGFHLQKQLLKSVGDALLSSVWSSAVNEVRIAASELSLEKWAALMAAAHTFTFGVTLYGSR